MTMDLGAVPETSADDAARRGVTGVPRRRPHHGDGHRRRRRCTCGPRSSPRIGDMALDSGRRDDLGPLADLAALGDEWGRVTSSELSISREWRQRHRGRRRSDPGRSSRWSRGHRRRRTSAPRRSTASPCAASGATSPTADLIGPGHWTPTTCASRGRSGGDAESTTTRRRRSTPCSRRCRSRCGSTTTATSARSPWSLDMAELMAGVDRARPASDLGDGDDVDDDVDGLLRLRRRVDRDRRPRRRQSTSPTSSSSSSEGRRRRAARRSAAPDEHVREMGAPPAPV